ncbi:MAG: isoprenoid biosynthesis glyoxalase ElbB [Flavobacteriales bacterium]
MKIGVLLSGCGVFDGAEIQEAVLTLLEIERMGAEAVCIGIDAPQYHVVNHLTGEIQIHPRNMLEEAARIARGQIIKINEVVPADIDALVIPGGFGSAKNFSDWAFNGPQGKLLPEVKLLLVNLYNVGKPIVALCVSPVLLALALPNVSLQLTLGHTAGSSPYQIQDFHDGIATLGALPNEMQLGEVLVDHENRIITAPCYMMDASILQVQQNIQNAMNALKSLLEA